MKLGLFLTETHLQVDIVSARNVTWNSNKLGQNMGKFSSTYCFFKTTIQFPSIFVYSYLYTKFLF